MRRYLNVFKLPLRSAWLVFILFGVVPFAISADYSFKWDANHPNDYVVAYRIYWSTSSGNFSASARKHIPVDTLSDPNNPQWTISIPDINPDQDYFFVCTAVDNQGYESDDSVEITTGDAPATPPPPPPPDTTAPVITVPPAAGSVGENSAIITWRTDEASDSVVQYGVNSATWGSYEHTKTSASLVTSRSIALTGLSAGTTYYVRVRSSDAAGNDRISGEFSFSTDETPPPTPPDTTAPLITSYSVNSITQSGAVIQWTTNENSDSKVGYGIDSTTWGNYAYLKSAASFIKSHSIALTGLLSNTTYYYRVRSSDAAGNTVTFNEHYFTTLKDSDTTAPLFAVQPSASHVNFNSATVYWRTNEVSDSEIRYDVSSNSWSAYANRQTAGSLVTNHSMTISGLSPGTTYYYRVRSRDAAGNAVTSGEVSFTTDEAPDSPPSPEEDTTAPVLTVPPSATAIESNSVTVYWRTNEASDSEIRYDVGSSAWSDYASQQVAISLVTNHSMTITGLSADTPYFCQVRSSDAAGNVVISDAFSFTTNPASVMPPPPETDTTPPGIMSSSKSHITQNSAVIQWTTNEESDSDVRYDIVSSSWDTYVLHQSSDTFVTTHTLVLTGLIPDTEYYYRFAAADTSGNQVISEEYRFTTLAGIDMAPPQFIAWPTVTDQSDTTATIEWSTHEVSDSQVQFDTVAGDWDSYSYVANDTRLAIRHVVTLTDLTPDTAYFFRVGSWDSVANGPAISAEQAFNTEPLPDEAEPTTTSPPTVVLMFVPTAPDQPGTLDSAIRALAGNEADTISVAISWRTDEASIGEVRYGRFSSTWDQYTHISMSDALSKNQTVILTDLLQDQRYYFRVGSTDVFGNGPSSDPSETNNPFAEQSFQTALPPDDTPPRIIDNPEVLNIDNASAVIVWETDEPSTSEVQYGLADAEWGAFSNSFQDMAMVKTHLAPLSGLIENTRYAFVVGSIDVAGNGPSVSSTANNPSSVDHFLTTTMADEAPPVIFNVEIMHLTDTTALIYWETEEPGNSLMQYDVSSQSWGDYAYSANDSEMTTTHHVTITGLQPETRYFYRVASTDTYGNGPFSDVDTANPSEENAFISDRSPDQDAPQISQVTIELDEVEKAVMLEWETSEPGNSQVSYGTSSQEWGDYDYSENNSELTRAHRVILTNIEMDMLYYVRVASVDAAGNSHDIAEDDQNPSPEYTFQLDSGSTNIELPIDPPFVPPTGTTPEGSGSSCFIKLIVDR